MPLSYGEKVGEIGFTSSVKIFIANPSKLPAWNGYYI
jgi:hypothetical protein